MNRTTERTESGELYLTPEPETDAYGNLTEKGFEQLDKIYDRLAAYEDTGLEPDEIPHWIPVSERLPEAGERVICKWGKFIGEGFRKELGGWERYYCLPLDVKVTHWMPLPAGPKEVTP